MSQKAKTNVGILASHDSVEKNAALARLFHFNATDRERRKRLTHFRFLFTGGTYGRLFGRLDSGDQPESPEATELPEETKFFLRSECGVIRLPAAKSGGVTVLANLISQRQVSLLWPFLTPLTTHLLTPENLALLRLADQWRVKKLMNSGSVNEWIQFEAERDAQLNPQTLPLRLDLSGSGTCVESKEQENGTHLLEEPAKIVSEGEVHGSAFSTGRSVVALISHDEMKSRMLDFVVDYERELGKFRKILTTGTTGKLTQEAAPRLSSKIYRYHSGPKGGDIEIATEILYGGCQVVIFFVDPLRPHPHSDDIRVIFGACMIHDEVRMLSNDVQARDWMDRVVRCT